MDRGIQRSTVRSVIRSTVWLIERSLDQTRPVQNRSKAFKPLRRYEASIDEKPRPSIAKETQ